MSSRIQKPRPWVAMARSPSFTTRSWTGTRGRFRRSDCQCAPSSRLTQTPRSVPAKRSPFRSGSSRITRVNSSAGMPSVILVQVFPKSVVL